MKRMRLLGMDLPISSTDDELIAVEISSDENCVRFLSKTDLHSLSRADELRRDSILHRKKRLGVAKSPKFKSTIWTTLAVKDDKELGAIICALC